ncbi:MAG: ribonuclease PH [Phycisphaerae bacterium]|nr:ribonuclease PH [Phycisphaerae bacterium]
MKRRADGRRADELRPIEIIRGYTQAAPGSVLIRTGRTHVLCTACIEDKVPPWLAGQGLGWVTAEYDMLPGATGQRRARNRGGKIDGRTQEIQRLIGRCMRAVVDRSAMGENCIWLDCDVLQADGGTRTVAITGAYLAMCDAVTWAVREKLLPASPIREAVAATSVGIVDGRALLDLCYTEDVAAAVDCNVAMTAGGRFIEVQGTGEDATFSRAELDKLLTLAGRGIRQRMAEQAAALKRRPRVGTTARRKT